MLLTDSVKNWYVIVWCYYMVSLVCQKCRYQVTSLVVAVRNEYFAVIRHCLPLFRWIGHLYACNKTTIMRNEIKVKKMTSAWYRFYVFFIESDVSRLRLEHYNIWNMVILLDNVRCTW